MKKVMILALVLVMALSFSLNALADPSSKNGNLPDIIEPNGGPYIIVTALSEDSVTFKYGWSNKNFFEKEPVSIWIGLYNVTDSGYKGNVAVYNLDENKPNYKGVWTLPLESGDRYKINFFIRWQLEPTTENIWWKELFIN